MNFLFWSPFGKNSAISQGTKMDDLGDELSIVVTFWIFHFGHLLGKNARDGSSSCRRRKPT
jgi:hypothetical protein